MQSWYYKGDLINAENLPENTVGFVYLIKNVTKEHLDKQPYLYIGKKSTISERTKKLGKRAIANLKDKRSSKKIKVVSQSDWEKYNGSNKDLLMDISNGDIIEKIIIEFCYSKTQLTYLETKHLFCNDVLEDDKYYNSNILGKFYKTI